MAEYAGLHLPKPQLFMEEAGLFRRLLAAFFDIILLDVIILVPFSEVLGKYAGGGILPNMAAFGSGLPAGLALVFFFASAACVVYFTLFTYFFRQTFGMMVVHSHVDGDLTLGKSFTRSVIAFPFFPFYLFWILEPVLVLWKGQGLLEKLTGTRTIIIRTM